MVNVAAALVRGGRLRWVCCCDGPVVVVLAACVVVLIAHFTLAGGLWAPVHEKYRARLALLQMQLFHYKLLTKNHKPLGTKNNFDWLAQFYKPLIYNHLQK